MLFMMLVIKVVFYGVCARTCLCVNVPTSLYMVVGVESAPVCVCLCICQWPCVHALYMEVHFLPCGSKNSCPI